MVRAIEYIYAYSVSDSDKLCLGVDGSSIIDPLAVGMHHMPPDEHDLSFLEGDDEDVITTTSDELAAPVVTYDDLVIALSKILGEKGMGPEEISKLALYLLNFFGYSDYIIDNILHTEDRDVFYMLEEEGLLTTEREEIYILKGKVWRIHYWMLRKRKILELSRGEEEEKKKKKKADEFSSVYDDMPDDLWSRDR